MTASTPEMSAGSGTVRHEPPFSPWIILAIALVALAILVIVILRGVL